MLVCMYMYDEGMYDREREKRNYYCGTLNNGYIWDQPFCSLAIVGNNRSVWRRAAFI